MSDTTAVADTSAKPKREKRSERTFIDATGKEVEKIEQATGARYALIGEGGRTFDVQLGEAGKLPTMFGIFGCWTKLGNVANTVINDKDAPGSVADAAADIEDFLTQAEAGVWRESEGPRGPKYDNAILATALHGLLTKDKLAKGDEAHYYTRLETDKSYRAKVVARDDVKAAYFAEQAKRGAQATPAAMDSLA